MGTDGKRYLAVYLGMRVPQVHSISHDEER